jgi:N-acyl-phosphatidylethanolamine-hydrolysing phospholipase D
MGPEDAIKAHIDLGFPRLSVGIHWATFMMSDEFYLAPKQILDSTWTAVNHTSDSKFITTAFGQTIYL